MANVPTVNDLNFSTEVLESSTPVLVDFTATWCGPCQQIAPFVAQLAEEYEGRVKVVALDIDQSPGMASQFGIHGVPTLKVFKGGQVVAEQTGAVPKAKIAELMNRAL